MFLRYILCAAAAYLLGSISTGVLLSHRLFHDDVRKHGSGGTGATNMLRTYGKKAAFLTGLGDFFKGTASVLIPSPNVAENHQYHNAMVLANHKAAVVIEEKDLTGEKLVAAVKEMTADPEKLREIGLAAKALGVPNACGHITDELLDLYKTHRK